MDRNLALELVRVTEAAALAGARWMGKGDPIQTDQAAFESARLALQSIQIRGHVATSLHIVQGSGEVSKKVLNIIACHHERYDGSGYPQGIAANAIPALARIAGLADAYDAMLTERPYAPARSSFDAIQELADTKNVLFQGSMVEHFVQAVGMFPTGAIVELNSGEVGVVVEQNATRRLRPKIVLILDKDKHKRNELTVLDLSKYTSAESGASTLWISKELETGVYGIAPDDYFL
jgi:hypothetical protein